MQPGRLVPILLIGCVVAVVAASLLHNRQPMPQFISLENTPINLSQTTHYFVWDTGPTLDLDTIWLANMYVGEPSSFLYNRDQRKTVGLLTNAWPAYRNGDGSKLFCTTFRTTASASQRWLYDSLYRISSGRIDLQYHTIETFWLLNLHDNSARPILDLPPDETAIAWKIAPDRRFAYNFINSDLTNRVYICDLEKGTAEGFQFSGLPCGWWNNRQILFGSPNGDLVLCDVLTKQIVPFISRETIIEQLQYYRIACDPAHTVAKSVWNGTNYSFYLTAQTFYTSYRDSFMLRIDPTSRTFTLVDTNFPFRPSGTFDSSQNFYVDTAGSHGTNINLYDVLHRTTTTIPIKWGPNPIRLSARVYHNQILYNNGELWTMNLDGTQKTRLFPPPEN